MLKSKSFRINHEIDKKPRVHELLHETKRLRWMKFLVIPLLIAFSLLLVLSNVNFSGESYELVVAPSGESQTIATQTPTKEVSTIASTNYDTPTEEVGLDSVEGNGKENKGDGGEKEGNGKENKGGENEAGDAVHVAAQYWKETLAIPAAKSFTCTDNNSCKTVICTGGPIYNIINEIEYFTKWCKNIYFDVIIEDCTFNKNTMGKYTFSGNFKMSTLIIRNCQLDTIVDNAFKYQSVNKLTNITFDGVQLKTLNAQTFNGLEAVKNFQLLNLLTQATSPLNAYNFLQPMAATLSNLVLQQTEESDSSNTIYDPTAWLGGNSDTVYSKLLYVDLSGTKFNDTLNGNTFAKLSAVQELRLANCSLSTIAENIFNDILATLKSLDLRYNRLQTLDGQFLATALGKSINIEFGWNLWSCDCDNVEIIEYMKQIENNSAAETVCATPTELQGIQIGNAQMRCDDTTTLSTIVTTVITTVAATTTTPATTTIMTNTTDQTTLETTVSDPETTAISPTIAIDNSTLPPTSSDTTVMPTSTDDTTEVTTVSMVPTSPTSSATVIYNTTLSTAAVTTSSSATTEGADVSESSVTTSPLVSTTPEPIITTTVIFPNTTTSNTALTALTTFLTSIPTSTIVETTTYEATTISNVTNTIETTSITATQTSTTTDTEETVESDSTDLTPPTTINTTLSPTTTPNASTITSATTSETNAPNSSLMTSTIEDDTTMETATSIATTTPQLTSTILIIFPGTTIIPIATMKTTENAETTSKGTTVNKTNITTTTSPATIPPTSKTCFLNISPKFLVCTDTIAIRLCDYDATFNVVPISARSVQLQIGKNANGLQAIYFQALNNSVSEEINVANKSSIDIDNLAPNRSYTFCLIPKGQTSTSPFNCRSAHLPLETAQPWLDHSDVVLFCTIAILITVVCVIVGVAVIYYLLRWRPTLLYGSKRLRRIASASHEVLLFPKPERTSVDMKTHALNELSKMDSSVSDTLTPENYLNIKSYDYMQYFKNAELERQRRVAHISLNQPPVHRAPALPPIVSGAATRRDNRLSYFSGYLPVRPNSQQSTAVLEGAPQPAHSTRGGAAARSPPEPVEVLENEYESLDYYQELF